MTYWHPLWQAPRPDEFEAGLAASRRARSLGSKTARERAYIDALAAFYDAPIQASDAAIQTATQTCHGVVTGDHKKGALAYEGKMAELTRSFPDDVEGRVFYALALLATASPTDTTYAHPLASARILEGLYPTHHDHPGIAHYLIHSYDYPPLAERGLPAARAYAQMAPWVPHALHMPSHIFTRLGMWQDSITSNLAAAAAARRYEERFHPGAHAAEELHALDYLTYAYLQAGEDDKAREIVGEVAKIERTYPSVDLVASYPFGAIPARFVLERRSWAEAAELTVPPLAKNLPFAEANVELARALGAAHLKDTSKARAAVDRIAALRDAIQDPKYSYFVKHVGVQHAAAEAWALQAEGKREAAAKELHDAADAEDALGKHPVTPGSVVPIRELYAELLLEQGDAASALREFERSLVSAPNRLAGLCGAARAADRARDVDKAHAYYARIVASAKGSARACVVDAQARLR
jgi:hypothetical protein